MQFIIDTDLTTEKTTITIDGVKLNDTENVASINFYADAPNKQYNDDGYVSLSIASFDSEGILKRQSFTKRPEMLNNVKPIGISDDLKLNDFTGFVGKQKHQKELSVDAIVDAIVEHCSKNEIVCASKEVLLKRSIESLQDKLEDLGLSSVLA